MPFEDLPLINGKMLCPNCLKEKRPMFRFCRSAVRYNEVSKRPILALKFMDHTENAAIFAQWLKTAGRDIWSNPPDLIVPVPLHYWRLMKRRYNQAALIAVELGKLTGLAVDTSSLVKHKSTRPQMSFSGKERLKNIRGVFRVKKPEHIRGKRILLVDDVWTTGSTARECAKTLKAAGALSVDVVTVARV
jgi:ComF family protein